MIALDLRMMGIGVAALVAAATVASCTSTTPTATPVQASNPRVTYNYNADEALLQANQNAAAYCAQYQSVPRTVNITDAVDASNGKSVVFECVPRGQATVMSSPALTPTPANPPLTYNYSTDQQLLDASRSAQAQCASIGSPRVTSTLTSSAMGLKTVTFQCNPM